MVPLPSMKFFLPESLRQVSPIHRNVGSGDKRRCRRNQPYHSRSNFLGRSKASNRVLILPPFLRITFSVAEHAPDHLCLDRARGNCVFTRMPFLANSRAALLLK